MVAENLSLPAGGAVADAPPEAPGREVFVFPASYAQERLWFLERFSPGTPLFNVPVAWRLDGALDAGALAAACRDLVARHETLRTTFTVEDGEPRQVIAADVPERVLAIVDLRGLEPGRRRRAARRRMRRAARTPFDLERGPLFRATLVRLRDEGHLLLLTLHHAVTDGWSLGVLGRDLAALYAGRRRGETPDLPEPPVQYADYAVWQRETLRGETLDRLLADWRERLDGAPELLELPTDRARPAEQSHRGGTAERELPAALGPAVERLARRAEATPFMVLAAAFAALLHRHAGVRDLVFGTAVANRRDRRLADLVGLFSNTLPLRLGVDPNRPFDDLVAATRDAALACFADQDLPFERLVDAMGVQRDPSRNPLLQVMFLQADDDGDAGLPLPGCAATRLPAGTGTAKYDLAVTARRRRGRWSLHADFARDLFDRATVARLLAGYEALLAAALDAPGRPLRELPAVPRALRHQLLVEWNDTAAAYPARRLDDGFLERAAAAPDAPAIVCPGARLTYGELAARAHRLARHLRALGAGPGTFVGVHLDRTPRMVEAVLGVLAAGAAYVPLERGWPSERIRWILEHERIHLLIGETATLPRLAQVGADHDDPLRVVLLDDAEGAAEAADGIALSRPDPAAPADPLPPAGDPDDLAYVIFTSGSTGRPKGVMVRHRAAAHLVDWVNRRFGVGPADTLLFVTALSFDLSVYDVFGTLAAGGTIRLATEAERADPQRLARILGEEGITFWDSAPAALQQLVPYLAPPEPGAEEPALARVFLSGDWVPLALPDRVRRAFPRAEVVALGGATEATVWSNFHRIRGVDPGWSSIPYGRPMDDARYHVLDPAMAPCPPGVPGDLCIGGECLSVGYAAAPRLTAARYVPDPFAGSAGGAGGGAPGSRLYRTGDRARYRHDGEIEFLGRLDTQVKVRGFRIELGEIEAVACEHPRVRDAIVVVRTDRPGDQRLVAYVLPEDAEKPPAADELAALAASLLPDYMLPAAWVILDEWPQSSTGKLDRSALPAPDAVGTAEEGRAADTGASRRASPRARAEQRIAAIWADVLDVAPAAISRDRSFFDQGGSSLSMAEVHVRLQEAFGREIPMVTLFRHPTIGELADELAPEDEAAAEIAEAAVEETDAGDAPAAAPAPALLARRRAANGAVAVVGMAGRFPGAADLDELWENLAAGVESIRVFSDDELLAAGVDPAHLDHPRYVKARGALDGADLFDAAFFELSPRETQVLDPQQRLFLECGWQALEDAGHPPRPDGPRVGVFAGLRHGDYGRAAAADPEIAAAVGRFQISLANQPDYLPTRLAYKLGLTGPGIAVQTACSTSLVAVHLARLALLAGDCDLAIAGGAAVSLHEVSGYFYLDGGIDSPDGHTRAFDAAAQGVVAGSGVGAVVLKRLDDAIADGDAIRAVVRGSAVNNDGARKVSFTAPSVEGQAQVVRAALDDAGVDPATIGYVETHGTATPLGDPIEVAALVQAFGDGAARGSCLLGSAKTNLGHLDAAAGVAGLIKTVLALERGLVPPSLHFREPNPEIDFARSPFRVAAELVDWPDTGAPRRAGVSSFGIGGTNAHAVLEEAPAAEESGEASPVQLLVVSAKTSSALAASRERLAAHLERTRPGGRRLADVAHTLAVGRRAFAHRAAVVARGAAEAAERLRGGPAAAGEAPAAAPEVAFLFPGQGAQHPGMAAELYAAEPTFREPVDRAAELLAPELGFDLRRVLFPLAGEGEAAARRLARTEVAQPALFVVEHALARLWTGWGVAPGAMLGHSLGEYVAACLAGVFTLPAALRLVVARGRLMGGLPPGDMLAVALGEAGARELLGELDEGGADEGARLALAAVNGRRSVTVSGPAEAVARLAAILERRKVAHRRLDTSHAFHSPMMEPALAPFRERVAAASPRPPRIPFVSNVTGGWIRDDEAADPGYWALHLRSTVRFHDGLATLLAEPGLALLEVGPGRTLASLARRHESAGAAARLTTSLPHPESDEGDLARLLGAAGELWTAGVTLDWDAFRRGGRRRRVPLPTYPFERRRYWIDGFDAPPEAAGAEAADAAAAGGGEPETDLERAVAGAVADLLGVGRVGRGDDFFDLGGSSLAGVQLGSLLADRLGVEMPSGFLLESPTVAEIAALAGSLAGGAAEGGAAPAPSSCLVRLQKPSSLAARRPLFLVHQVGGHVYTFRPLSRALGRDQPLYAFRSYGLEAREEPFGSIEEMAAHYLGLLRAEQRRGPHRIGGASMGGMVAFEMARRLADEGDPPELLVLMDTPCLDQMPAREDNADPVRLVVRERTGVELDAGELTGLPFDERWERALAALRGRGEEAGDFDPEEARRLARVIDANVAALYAYEPRPLDVRALFFRAAERREVDPPRPELPWIELARGGTETVVVPGGHESMHEPPHVETLARHLAARLEALPGGRR